MIGINTYLHLALKLRQRLEILDIDSFLLGAAYPESWNREEKDDFTLGYDFQVWLNHQEFAFEMNDISKYDRLICDMEEILETIQHLNSFSYEGEKNLAMQHILSLEREAMPLYMVSREKKKRYEKLLDLIVDKYINECL